MRQLLPSRPGDKTDRAWLLFMPAQRRSGLARVGRDRPGQWHRSRQRPTCRGRQGRAAGQGRKGGSRPPRRGAAKSAAAPAAADGTTPPARENMLQWAIRASGPIGVLLLLLSIYFTALVIRLFMEFRVSEAVPAALVDQLEAAIRDKKFQDAYDVCKDNDSFLARLVRTGIANLPNGRPEAKEAMQTADRRDRHQPGNEDQLPGDHRHPGADDRAGGHDLGDDHELPGDRHGRRRPAQAREGRRGDLDGPVHHPRRRLARRSRRSSSSPSSAIGSPR